MINAYIPGPSSASEKRTAITLDFFEHAQMTGQTFKFYPVQYAPSAATSPSMASPSVDSVNSSLNVSPLTPSWDWSAASVSSATSSSRVSSQRQRESKTNSPTSRHQTTDFSHLPGMKILTKDGLDVTHSASRGSKTKEQRDHAHLMRIIKACDSCRRKKIRCDPSHKKRGAGQVAPQSTPKSTKKVKAVQTEAPPPCPMPTASTTPEVFFPGSSLFEFDPTFSFTGLEEFDPANAAYDPFDEFMQFPTMDTPDLDFPLATPDFSFSQSSSSSSAVSPLKLVTPTSLQESGPPPGSELVHPELQTRSPNFPFLDNSGSSSNYTDFNLYSPSSSFSEDERMLVISSSNSSLPNLNESSLSECPPATSEAVTNRELTDWYDSGLSIDDLQSHPADEFAGGTGHKDPRSSDQLITTSTFGEPRNESHSSLRTTPPSQSASPAIISCPSGSELIAGDTSPSGRSVPNTLSDKSDGTLQASSPFSAKLSCSPIADEAQSPSADLTQFTDAQTSGYEGAHAQATRNTRTSFVTVQGHVPSLLEDCNAVGIQRAQGLADAVWYRAHEVADAVAAMSQLVLDVFCAGMAVLEQHNASRSSQASTKQQRELPLSWETTRQSALAFSAHTSVLSLCVV